MEEMLRSMNTQKNEERELAWVVSILLGYGHNGWGGCLLSSAFGLAHHMQLRPSRQSGLRSPGPVANGIAAEVVSCGCGSLLKMEAHTYSTLQKANGLQRYLWTSFWGSPFHTDSWLQIPPRERWAKAGRRS